MMQGQKNIKVFVSDNDDLWSTMFMTHSITTIHDVDTNPTVSSARFISDSVPWNSVLSVLQNLSEFIFFNITRSSSQIVYFQVAHETNCTLDKHISNYSLQFT